MNTLIPDGRGVAPRPSPDAPSGAPSGLSSTASPVLPEPVSPAEARAELATCLLYVFFAWLWIAGLLFGLAAPEGPGPVLFGLPLWFSLSCILAYLVTSAAVVWSVRRFFQ